MDIDFASYEPEFSYDAPTLDFAGDGGADASAIDAGDTGWQPSEAQAGPGLDSLAALPPPEVYVPPQDELPRLDGLMLAAVDAQAPSGTQLGAELGAGAEELPAEAGPDHEDLKLLRQEQAVVDRLDMPRRMAERWDYATTVYSMPDDTGLNAQERAALYAHGFYNSPETSQAAKDALDRGEAVMFGLRNETNFRANHGQGLYDDRMVVLRRDSAGEVQVVYRNNYNADPSGRYEDGGPFQTSGAEGVNVGGDSRLDLGRIKEGTYLYERGTREVAAYGALVNGPYNVLVPVDPVRVERDISHGGVPSKEVDGDRSFLFHRGNLNTGVASAGCQTFRGEAEFARFFNSLGLSNSGQQRIHFVLKNMDATSL